MKARSKTRIAAVAAVVAAVCWAGTAVAQTPNIAWYNAAGTSFEISNANQLAGLGTIVNGGLDDFAGKTVKLTGNIDLAAYSAGEGWAPIGTNDNPFRGTFDGDGHVVFDMIINRPEETGVGLFGYITNGEVKNLGLENVKVTGYTYVGGLVGNVNTYGVLAGGEIYISMCYTTGTIIGNGTGIGGIVGTFQRGGGIANSYSTASVSGVGTYAGGIVGSLGLGSSTIRNCYSVGAISGVTGVGGIVGGRGGNSRDDVITGNAALNPEVKATRETNPTVGRIAGSILSTPTNNVAFSGVKNVAGTTEWDNKGASGRDGEDISADEIMTNRTIDGRFMTASGWTVAAGKLPGLFGNTVDMPEHLNENIINAAQPAITAHPASGTVMVGGSHTMTVAATLSDDGVLSYQWFSNTSAVNIGGTLIPNVSGVSYSPPADVSGTFYYYAVAINTNHGVNGQNVATSRSDVATLTVNSPTSAAIPVIASHPASDVVESGTAQTFKVEADATDDGTLSYQWYSNASASNTGGTAIDGATDASYEYESTEAGFYYFYAVVTNTNDNASGEKTASVTSNVAVLVVVAPDVIAVADIERVVPGDAGETAVVAPVRAVSAKLTAGPNVVGRSGAVNFYRVGKSIRSGTLTIYSASGNVVSRVRVADSRDAMHCVSTPESGRRVVGTWDLKDAKGRPVSEGAYLVRGVVVAVDGSKEKVSLRVSVR